MNSGSDSEYRPLTVRAEFQNKSIKSLHEIILATNYSEIVLYGIKPSWTDLTRVFNERGVLIAFLFIQKSTHRYSNPFKASPAYFDLNCLLWNNGFWFTVMPVDIFKFYRAYKKKMSNWTFEWIFENNRRVIFTLNL